MNYTEIKNELLARGWKLTKDTLIGDGLDNYNDVRVFTQVYKDLNTKKLVPISVSIATDGELIYEIYFVGQLDNDEVTTREILPKFTCDAADLADELTQDAVMFCYDNTVNRNTGVRIEFNADDFRFVEMQHGSNIFHGYLIRYHELDTNGFFALPKEERERIYNLARQIPVEEPNKFYDALKNIGYKMTYNAFVSVYEALEISKGA